MKKRKEPLFPELAAEMARNGMNNDDLGIIIGASSASVSMRMNGQTQFTLSEAILISDFFKKSVDALFRSSHR